MAPLMSVIPFQGCPAMAFSRKKVQPPIRNSSGVSALCLPMDAQLAGNIFPSAQQLLTDSLSGETEDQTSLISDPHAGHRACGSVFRARGI